MDTTVSGTIIAKISHVVGEHMSAKIRIQLPQQEIPSDLIDLNTIFCLDKSGSMSGGPIRDAKGALQSFIRKFAKMEVPITIYTFASRFECLSSEELGYLGLEEHIEKLRAGGGTQFGPVIQHMRDFIVQKSATNVYCVWLSDGQDNKGLANLVPILADYKEELDNNGISSAIHCIGFSEDHDAELLNRIIGSGTRAGTFQFVPSGGRIPVAVNNIFELAFQSSIYARLHLENDGTQKKIQLEEDPDNPNNLIGTFFISEYDMQNCTVRVHKGGNIWVFNLDFEREEYKDVSELVHIVSNFVSVKVQEAIDQTGGSTMEKLRELRQIVDEMDRRIEDLRGQIMKLRVLQRKQLEPFIFTARDLISNFYMIIRERAGTELSNMDLAQLNSLAHKSILKRSLEKKIAKKAGENLDYLNQSERLISQIAQEIDMEELQKKYGNEADKYGECIISCNNWLESLKEGDCLCLTFHIERPKGGVIDPLQFKIIKINTSLVSAESFISSALFQGKAGQIIEGGSRFQQDGEAPKASSLVPGLPDEIINGILPIYINEDHWRVASLRFRPLLAWNITVDVLGYDERQMYTIPFMLMAKANQDASSGFSKIQLELITDTCKVLYRENRNKMLAYLTDLLQDYIQNPLVRLPDKISNTAIFLCSMYCAYSHGDMDLKVTQIFPLMFEEEVRRATRESRSIQKLINDLLGISKELVIKTFNISNLIEEITRNPTAKINIPIEEYRFNGRINEFTPLTLKIIESLHVLMANPNSYMNRTIKLFSLFGEQPYTCLADAGLVTNEQVLTLIIQSILYQDNKSMRQAIADHIVINPFDEQAALEYIQEVYSNALKTEALIYRNNLVKEVLQKGGQELTYHFALTDDLQRAANILKGATQGAGIQPQYFKALMNNSALNVIEKVKMLTTGVYNGEVLIQDKSKTGELKVWIPKKNTVFKLWKVHRNDGQLSEWQQAFPGREEYLQHQENRANGEFVPYSRPRKNCKDKRHCWDNIKHEHQPRKHRKDKNKKNPRQPTIVRGVRAFRGLRRVR